jgi:hypothetical protein
MKLRTEIIEEGVRVSYGQGGGVSSSLSNSLQVASFRLLPTAAHVEETSSFVSDFGTVE